MNTSEIEKLLDKYYDGMTSVEEEQLLKEFFLMDSIPPQLQIHAAQFRYFSSMSADVITDPLFEESFLEKVNEPNVLRLRSNRDRFYYITSIAAGILLLIGLFFTFREDVVRKSGRNARVSEQEIVLQQATDILMLVSVNLNKGMDKMQYLGKFDQSIQKIQMISKFYQYQNLIINPDPINSKSINPEKQ